MLDIFVALAIPSILALVSGLAFWLHRSRSMAPTPIPIRHTHPRNPQRPRR